MKITHSVIFEGKRHTVLSRAERYAIGLIEPHYPLPVPMAVADTMLLHIVVCKGLLGECHNCIWPNCEC